jgi:hypothetical protein
VAVSSGAPHRQETQVSTSPDPQPNHTELCGRIGIPFFIVILSAGLGGLVTGRTPGVILALIGLAGLALMAHLLKWHRFTILHGLISAMTALVASWILLAYVLWPQPTTYVNPLHSETTKWNMAKDLHWWATSPQHPNCQIAIVRYPETYSQDYHLTLRKFWM